MCVTILDSLLVMMNDGFKAMSKNYLGVYVWVLIGSNSDTTKLCSRRETKSKGDGLKHVQDYAKLKILIFFFHEESEYG